MKTSIALLVSLIVFLAAAAATPARAGDDPEPALPQEVPALEGTSAAAASQDGPELKTLAVKIVALRAAADDIALGITCVPSCQSFEKAYRELQTVVKKGVKAHGSSDLGKKIAEFGDDAIHLMGKAQAEIPWCLKPHQAQVEAQLKAMLADGLLMRNLDRMPCKAWYDAVMLRRDGERFVLRYGKGGWAKNAAAGLFGDETVQCKQRSRLFALDETALDPFTAKDSGLPYEDFERKVNRRRESKTWALEERTIRADEYNIDFGPIKLYNQSHTVPVYTYKGPFRKGADTRWPKFIVDTWEPSGDFILSSEERWLKRFPSKSGR